MSNYDYKELKKCLTVEETAKINLLECLIIKPDENLNLIVALADSILVHNDNEYMCAFLRKYNVIDIIQNGNYFTVKAFMEKHICLMIFYIIKQN